VDADGDGDCYLLKGCYFDKVMLCEDDDVRMRLAEADDDEIVHFLGETGQNCRNDVEI
jgi:hypothetical protein